MIIHRIDLTNFRGFENASFTFGPGVNIIAGVNGAGKSSVLDALRITLSRALAKDYKTREQSVGHSRSDFRYGTAFWTLTLSYSLTEQSSPFEFLAHVNLEENLTVNTTEVRHGSVVRPNQFEFTKLGQLVLDSIPICLYFSPHRTLVENRTLPVEAGAEAVRAGAFALRPLNVWHLAQWWLAQIALGQEIPAARARSEQIKETLLTFLPDFSDVTPTGGDQPDLIFTKGRSMLTTGQLSDGERSIISLVLEIARRFSLAYPRDEAPFLTRGGCVLVDELELHLHPRWQREVVVKLKDTFPKCQFIVTTHSPQMIGEVDHERVHMIGKEPLDQTLGMDSAWILRNVMDTPDRSEETGNEIHRVEEALKAKNPTEALRLVEDIELRFGGFDKLQALRTKAEIMLRLKK